MWSDTLLAAERSHLIRLAIWGATSATIGTMLVVTLTLRRIAAPIITHFAIQTLAWGSLNLVLATVAWRSLAMRDVTAARRLDHIAWLSTGLDVGLVAVGLTLVLVGSIPGRRLGVIGAGLGVVVQGLALLILHLMFIGVLTRLV